VDLASSPTELADVAEVADVAERVVPLGSGSSSIELLRERPLDNRSRQRDKPQPAAQPTEPLAARTSVVLVNFNSGPWGARAAMSARRQVGAATELVVIDNASTDGSLDRIVRAVKPDRVIRNPVNLGYAAAVNQGIAATTAEFVLPLNSDAAIAPDYVRHAHEIFDQSPRVAVVGGRVLTTTGDVERGPLRVTFTMRVRDLDLDGGRDCFRVDGSCAMLRRSALEEVVATSGVGPFDPRFFIYGETIDLAFKLRALGWTTRYQPLMRAEHVRSHSSAVRIADKRGLMRQLVLASRHINVARHSRFGVRWLAHAVCITQDVGFAAVRWVQGDRSAPADVIGGWRRALRRSGRTPTVSIEQ
jgi:N-acetylglucosaminyl-diphospho-decaprenol L-rhamnosyltransferase